MSYFKALKQQKFHSGTSSGGLMAQILRGSASAGNRGTEALLVALGSSTWPHLANAIVAGREAEAQWSLLRPGPRSSRREFEINRLKLVQATSSERSVQARQELAEDMKASGFITQQMIHPFLDMLRQGTMPLPEPLFQLPGFEIARLFSTTRRAVGSFAFWITKRNPEGAPTQWIPIPPHWLNPQSLGPDDPFTATTVFDIAEFGQSQIPARDIAWYRNPNPARPYDEDGRGNMHAVDNEIQLDELASRHQSSKLMNRGIPDLLLALSGMTQTEKTVLESDWRQALHGPNRSGKTHFLKVPEGLKASDAIMIKELEQTAADMQVTEGRARSRDAILMGSEVPPLAAGEQRSGNRAMALVAEKALELNAVRPGLETVRMFYQTRLFEPVGGRAPEYRGGWIVQWERQVLTDEDSRDRLMARVPGHYSRKQFMQAAGFEPQPGDQNIFALPTSHTLVNRRGKPLQEPEAPPPVNPTNQPPPVTGEDRPAGV